MSDAREALVALIRSAGEVGDEFTFECDCGSCVRVAGRIADAILAEFDATPRGVHNHDIDPACPETRLPDGSLRGACTTNVTPPTVKPSVEDVARALWELDEQEADTTGGALGVPWSALDSLTRDLYRADAEDLLALLPGRTEAEVKAEAWDEGFTRGFYDVLAGGDRDSSETSAINPYRKEADNE